MSYNIAFHEGYGYNYIPKMIAEIMFHITIGFSHVSLEN